MTNAERDATDTFDHAAALRACGSGDRDALQRIFERDGDRLLGVAMRIVRDRGLAEDVVHDAFVRIWRHAAGFDADLASPRDLIFTIVRNSALNAARDRGREVLVDEERRAAVPDSAAEPHGALGRIADAEPLKRCLARLDSNRRTSLLLAYVDGYSHPQIAARLNVPAGTVKAWMRRSLVMLRECLA